VKLRRLGCKVGLVLALFLYAPAALACPVCFSAKNEENRVAFIVTTAFLTFLPLGLIGGGVWWLRRRSRQESQAADLRRPPKPKKPARASSRPILSGFEDIPPAG
jgi:high-affinity Fe2+/Pb2+ permease